MTFFKNFNPFYEHMFAIMRLFWLNLKLLYFMVRLNLSAGRDLHVPVPNILQQATIPKMATLISVKCFAILL